MDDRFSATNRSGLGARPPSDQDPPSAFHKGGDLEEGAAAEEEDVILVRLERDGGVIKVGSSGWADAIADTAEMRMTLLGCLQSLLQSL